MNIAFNEADEALSNLLVVRDKDGRIAVTIGLIITVYFTNQRTRVIREAVAELAEEYITLLGENLRWVLPQDVNRYFRVGSSRARRPKAWLLDHPEEKSWRFEFHGGATSDAASAFNVQGYGMRKRWDDGLGFFHLALPLLWFAEHPGTLLDYTLNICNRLHPISGCGGIGVLEPTDGYAANNFQDVVALFADRFPGLEVENRIGHANYLRSGIKSVNWLTVVGDRWLEELGGLSHFGTKLANGLTLETYDGGAILQAGATPEIGDVETNRWPQHYIAAAKLLKKVQLKSHRSFHFGGEGHMTNESSEAWLFRFDRE